MKLEPKEIYSSYQRCEEYKNSIDLPLQIQRCINFYEGRQFSNRVEIENYPKIVLNIIKQIVNTRASGILQNEYSYLINSNNFGSIRKISNWLSYLANDMKLKKHDLETLRAAFLKGTAIQYMYWDTQSKGLLSRSGGRLIAKNIDIRDIAVADIHEKDIQKQEYIIYRSKQKKKDIERQFKIKEGEILGSYEEDIEVYTTFYRNEEGEVMFMISTSEKTLKEPSALNYEKNKKRSLKKETINNEIGLMENEVDNKLYEPTFGKYPFVRLVFDERDNSFYGVPMIYELIEAQKSINMHFSVYDKSIQDNIIGGFMMRKGVVDPEDITTDNAQILELDTLPNEDIRTVLARIPAGSIPPEANIYAQTLLNISKSVSGVTNIQIGQADFSGQSGKQTEMLLERARENTSHYSYIFNEFKVEQAEIMFLFSKFYYDNEDFTIIKHGFEEDFEESYIGENKFNGRDYINDRVQITIKVGVAQSYSEYANLDLLGKMVQSGQAPLKTYILALNDNSFNKQELLKALSENEKQENNRLKERLESMEKQNKILVEAYNKEKENFENVHLIKQENERLKQMIADMSIKQITLSNELGKKYLESEKDKNVISNLIRKGGIENEKGL